MTNAITRMTNATSNLREVNAKLRETDKSIATLTDIKSTVAGDFGGADASITATVGGETLEGLKEARNGLVQQREALLQPMDPATFEKVKDIFDASAASPVAYDDLTKWRDAPSDAGASKEGIRAIQDVLTKWSVHVGESIDKSVPAAKHALVNRGLQAVFGPASIPFRATLGAVEGLLDGIDQKLKSKVPEFARFLSEKLPELEAQLGTVSAKASFEAYGFRLTDEQAEALQPHFETSSAQIVTVLKDTLSQLAAGTSEMKISSLLGAFVRDMDAVKSTGVVADALLSALYPEDAAKAERA